MASHDWTVAKLRQVLPLDDDALGQIADHANSLAEADAAAHFQTLLDGSVEADAFVVEYLERRGKSTTLTAARTAGANEALPSYRRTVHAERHRHTNAFTEAARLRAPDEQEIQQQLQELQYQFGIYNSDIVPKHLCDSCSSCPVHEYERKCYKRLPVLYRWSKAVRYPGDKSYNWSNPYSGWSSIFTANDDGIQCKVDPQRHTLYLHRTIALNIKLNEEAQARVDAREPTYNIWAADDQPGTAPPPPGTRLPSRRDRNKAAELRNAILLEEHGRWPSPAWRRLVAAYQAQVGMVAQIAALRAHAPNQYLHLLRAGYFEPIPVAWAIKASNPLMFAIDPENGVRGITPAWRGYDNLAAERLYWVRTHRAAASGATADSRLKPDPISALRMANDRMARAVEPPPLYFAADDTCIMQNTTAGYSMQVLPAPFHADGLPEQAGDDTMILLDVSGSMDFAPVRPVYDQYVITGYTKTNQPKNRDVARAILRRFTHALDSRHADRPSQGYDLVTFSDRAAYLGPVHHANFDAAWNRVVFGGRTRVMAGWQLAKDLHFQKYAATATNHPVYGWQAGPVTPVLRLLLVLDGEAADMDEFELDLLGLSWAHVTIFLLGVDGCTHHHRHANELERISDVNPHVSFVDAQGNFPERFVTHELLKRHLGYDLPLHDFERMEQLPAYAERV